MDKVQYIIAPTLARQLEAKKLMEELAEDILAIKCYTPEEIGLPSKEDSE
jgi:hypothetical protein